MQVTKGKGRGVRKQHPVHGVCLHLHVQYEHTLMYCKNVQLSIPSVDRCKQQKTVVSQLRF